MSQSSMLLLFIILVAPMAILGIVVWILSRPGPLRGEEVPAFPGTVVYNEGRSAFPKIQDQALSAVMQGDLTEAEKHYQRLISLEPKNPLGYLGIAGCRFQQQNLEAAEQYYQMAHSLNPRFISPLIGLGAVAYTRAAYVISIDYFQQALALKKNLAKGYLGLAQCYEALSDWEQALHAFERFLQLVPQSNSASAVRAKVAELRKQVSGH